MSDLERRTFDQTLNVLRMPSSLSCARAGADTERSLGDAFNNVPGRYSSLSQDIADAVTSALHWANRKLRNDRHDR